MAFSILLSSKSGNDISSSSPRFFEKAKTDLRRASLTFPHLGQFGFFFVFTDLEKKLKIIWHSLQ
jgi:hypothetical protein